MYKGLTMRKLIYLFAVLISSAVVSSPVHAEGPINTKNIYVGGGLAFNSLPGYGSSRGFQFFGGYDFDFKLNEDISSALEFGYTNSGKFDRLTTAPKSEAVKGVWLAMLESVPLSSKTDMLVRLGYDFGDDDGFILGTGLQYKFDTKVAMRMEYVAREHVNALQANVLFHF
jgi:hypothetical protein